MVNFEDNSPGQSIESDSFRIIDQEVPEPRPFSGYHWQVARRMIHASADFELLSLICFHNQAIDSGLEALRKGSLIITDTEMVRVGITKLRMKELGCQVVCYLNHPETKQLAKLNNQTRSQAAMKAAVKSIDGNICVIGNSPTALRQLIQDYIDGHLKPALVVAMPVGFVGAKESKELVLEQENLPFIVIKGRKGGSALAASCINALAEIALQEIKK